MARERKSDRAIQRQLTALKRRGEEWRSSAFDRGFIEGARSALLWTTRDYPTPSRMVTLSEDFSKVAKRGRRHGR